MLHQSMTWHLARRSGPSKKSRPLGVREWDTKLLFVHFELWEQFSSPFNWHVGTLFISWSFACVDVWSGPRVGAANLRLGQQPMCRTNTAATTFIFFFSVNPAPLMLISRLDGGLLRTFEDVATLYLPTELRARPTQQCVRRASGILWCDLRVDLPTALGYTAPAPLVISRDVFFELESPHLILPRWSFSMTFWGLPKLIKL